MYYWITYIALFLIGLIMQIVAWRRKELEECGHKAVFIMVIAVVLAVTHLTVL